jgi:hypothetical protein
VCRAERARSYAGVAIQLDPALIEGFGQLMWEHLTSGSIPFRKAYLQSVIDTVEVDDAQSASGQQGCAGKSSAGQARRHVWAFADEF